MDAVSGGGARGEAERVRRPAVPDVPVDELGNVDVMALYVERFGPRCAAWLVRRFRRQVRKHRCFHVRCPKGAELPPWFRIARACLEKSDRWCVGESEGVASRLFVFRFLGRVPASIRPVN